MENLKSSAASNCSPTYRDTYSAMKDTGLDAVFFEVNQGAAQDDALNSLSLNNSIYEIARMPVDACASVKYLDLIMDSIVKVLKSEDKIHRSEISSCLISHIGKLDREIFLSEKNRLPSLTPIENRLNLRQRVMVIISDKTIFNPSYLNKSDLSVYESINGKKAKKHDDTKKHDNNCLIQ